MPPVKPRPVFVPPKPRPIFDGLVIVTLCSLVPWMAFLFGFAVSGDDPVTGGKIWGGLVFVGGFSSLPLAVARNGLVRVCVIVVMSAVAAYVGMFIATSESSTAGLSVLLVAYAAIPSTLVIWVGQAVATSRRRARTARGNLAASSDRLAALAVDVALLFAVLVVPLTMLSHAKQEIVAAVIAGSAATLYLAGCTLWKGQTLGQALLLLELVDVETRGRVTVPQALLRSLVIVVEIVGVFAIVFAPLAIAELIAASASGRSLTDRLLRTAVVTTR